MKRSLTTLLLIIFTITLSITLYTANAQAKDKDAKPADSAKPAQPIDPSDEVIVTVNDYVITYKNHRVAINALMPKMAYHKSVSEARMKIIEDRALEDLIVSQLLYEEALKRKMSTTAREIKIRIRAFQNRLPKGMTLRKLLKQSDMTRDDLKEEFRRDILVKRIKADVEKELKAEVNTLITEEFMKKFYDENIDKFVEPEKTHVSEILLKADPAGGKKHWLEVRDKALAVLKRIRGGEDFAEVAKKVSEDPYASGGGDMGWAHTGSMDPSVEQAVYKLKVGEISEPVESLYGYHILKLHERKKQKLKPYDELNKENLKKRLVKSEYKKAHKEWVENLKSKADIKYYEIEYVD
jgi:peptidyl-prolyl cis-trans isomerase C